MISLVERAAGPFSRKGTQALAQEIVPHRNRTPHTCYGTWRADGFVARAKLQFSKFPLALGGGIGYTCHVLPRMGETTDYPHVGRARCPQRAAHRRVWVCVKVKCEKLNHRTTFEEGHCLRAVSPPSCIVRRFSHTPTLMHRRGCLFPRIASEIW